MDEIKSLILAVLQMEAVITAVVSFIVGIVATKYIPNLTPKQRTWSKFLADKGTDFFFEVEDKADELGIKGYEKLARFLGLLSESLGRSMTPEEQADASTFAAEMAKSLKN